jgi:5S rRNA maturation endonuclease (ribonuclease M5)
MIGVKQRDAGVVITEIRFLQNAHPKAVLLLEGETDHRFWKKFVSAEHYHLVSSGGKPTLLRVVARLDSLGNTDVIALFDCDFDRILQRLSNSSRVAYTHAHDLETELVASSALEVLVTSFVTSADSVRALENLRIEDGSLLCALVKRALPFGQLRLHNELSELKISFDEIIQSKEYFCKNWTLNIARLHEKYADATNLTLEQLANSILRLPAAPELELVQGHELLTILAFAFGRTIKSSPKPHSGADVMNLLAALTDVLALRDTTMFQNLDAVRLRYELPAILKAG